MTAKFLDLKDAPVFITGGGSGIGAALTEGFVAQGAKVAFCGRSDYSDFAEKLGAEHGNKPLFLQCDVTDTDALRDAMEEAQRRHGPLRVQVNNAANDQRYRPEEVTPKIWDDMLAVNLKHFFFASQKAAELMEHGGSIINYSSVSYMIGEELLSPYTAANAAMIGMTRSLSRAWGKRGIRVNCIAPGWVMTEKQKEKWATEEALAEHKKRQCLPDLMQPEDMVGPTLFLASDASKAMTAQMMIVDAGVVGTG